MDTTTITDEQAVQAMTQYGGSFMKKLGQLWQSADPLRRARLKEAFRDDFDRYREMAGQTAPAHMNGVKAGKDMRCKCCAALYCNCARAGAGQTAEA